MIKKIIYICTLMFSFILIAQSTINKDLNDFTTLQVYNGIEVTLVKSSDQKIEITGGKSEMVVIKNTNNTLKLALPFSTSPEKNAANGQISVQLFYNKNINSIEVNDESTLIGKDIDQTKLVLNAQERGYINLSSVKTENLEVKASSGGIIELSGTTKNQNADIDLYGTYHSFDLKADGISTVECGTGAKAEILAGETLNAKVSFGGSIFYKGNPKLIKDKKVIGGIIKKRD